MREAYYAFHSKKYSKRRKALRSAAQQKMPQVGKDTNIEYLLTDSSFAERVAPPIAILIFRLSVKLDIAQLRSGFALRRQYSRTWLCLACDYQWVGAKDNAQKT